MNIGQVVSKGRFIHMKKLIWIVVIFGLLGVCVWLFFNYLVWAIPSQPRTQGMALADLDGDGDLDAFLANGRNEGTVPNTVLWNDGNGRFQDSDQQLGEAGSVAVILRDFDGDGDALVSNSWGTYLEYFWNNGRGQFQKSQDVPVPARGGRFVGIWRLDAADLNGDNHVDLFLIGCCGGGNGHVDWQTYNAFNSVWLTDDHGLPRNNGQQFGSGSSEAVALADLDSDGDLDAFTANSAYLDDAGESVDYDPNMVWLNDGRGLFTDSGQRLGSRRSYAIALGDLDGDGDSDAFVGNRGSDKIWLNDGHANFTDSGQALGDTLTRFLYLSDLDGDGDLDAFLGSNKQGRIWLNDGRGDFSDSGQRIKYSNHHAVTLGDVDGNSAVDIVVGKLDGAVAWFNDSTGQMHRE